MVMDADTLLDTWIRFPLWLGLGALFSFAVMYAALAAAKILPKVQPPDLRRGQRSETRGIHPEGHEGPGHADESREEVGVGSRGP